MSQIAVNTLTASGVTSANTIVASNATINSTGITLFSGNAIVNSASITIKGAGANLHSIAPETSVQAFIIGSNTNVFANSLDIFAWANSATLINMTHSRDYSIPVSPANGIPYKIDPTAVDPAPQTYNSGAWNIAPTKNGDIWKISGFLRSNADLIINDNQYLLVLPANSSGQYGTAGTANNALAITLTANTWTKFDFFTTISGNANTAYIQIRPDGYELGTAVLWYDGIKVEKVTKILTTETVNTQIFSVAGSNTWTKPSWANTGNELVVVHLWGGGGGAVSNATFFAGAGGGAFVFGYFKSSQVNAVCNVVVGAGGTGGTTLAGASNGGSSVFYANTTIALTAYGGTSPPSTTLWGMGGGWLSAANTTAGGDPLGGNSTSTSSTFGGGYGGNTTAVAGSSIYGGGGGSNVSAQPGNSIFGGGGGGSTSFGSSVYGGFGANSTAAAKIPGGGGGWSTNGARGEIRVYTYRITR